MGSVKSDQNGVVESFSSIILSIKPSASVFGLEVCLLLLSWAVVGGVRLRYSDQKVVRDLFLFGLVNIWVSRDTLLETIWKSWNTFERSLKMDDRSAQPTSVLIGIFTLAVFGYFLHQRGRNSQNILPETLPEGSHKWTLDHPESLIFPCRTKHARIFPKKHAFEYTYLLCGFPVIPAITTADGEDKGDGKDMIMGSWWLQTKAADYLQRGYGVLGFYGKLKYYLREQGVSDADWSYAYLVTAPRFFGYSFNPVSFWYIYDKDHELKRLILEVNNTFGERRVYLLDGSNSSNLPQFSDLEPATGSDAAKPRFTDSWMKDFHVSPFNSRKGSYSLKALDPFGIAHSPHPKINNTITLRSSKDHAKLVARVDSIGKPLESAKMGYYETLRFVSSWWWVGFVTFPRIAREAFKLYYKRSLHVWFRPEVLAASIGRAPTATEVTLQNIFYDYLNHLVQQSPEALEVDCETAISQVPKRKVTTKQQPGREENVKKLNLHISTPAFYSRFVHYAHTSEALDRECLFTDEKNRTLWISHPNILSNLLPKWGRLRDESNLPVKRTFFDELRWTFLRKLRCPPPDPAYVVTPKSTGFNVDDIRTLPYSELDKFVRDSESRQYAYLYRRMVTKIFLAQRFTLGSTEIIDTIDFVLRFLLCWFGAMKLASWAQTIEQRIGPGTEGCGGALHSMELWRMSVIAISVCGCHIYSLLKGYR